MLGNLEEMVLKERWKYMMAAVKMAATASLPPTTTVSQYASELE